MCVLVCDDRIARGERENNPGDLARHLITQAGHRVSQVVVLAEGADALRPALCDAIALGNRVVFIVGGTGIGLGNDSPEVAREFIECELPGIAEQIRAHGLAATPLSSLSRCVAGVTSRSHGVVIVAGPGSRGGVKDTLAVVLPLVGALVRQMDEDPD